MDLMETQSMVFSGRDTSRLSRAILNVLVGNLCGFSGAMSTEISPLTWDLLMTLYLLDW